MFSGGNERVYWKQIGEGVSVSRGNCKFSPYSRARSHNC